MPDATYVEAIAEWLDPSQQAAVERWLEQHRLGWIPMAEGLLITGDRSTFEASFGVDTTSPPPVHVTIPAELREILRAITIPQPRQIHL